MDELYKGYVITKNKKSIEKIQGVKEFKTLEEVMDCNEYAGVLADDVVVIDIDDMAQSEILMKIVEHLQLNCRVYVTKRGRHFVFKNSGIKSCGTGKRLACGLDADIKVGGKNTYEVIKFEGEDRFIEWDAEGEYDLLPKWLFPIKCDVDFFNMEEGDGRNSTLYSYILTLNNYGFSKQESRDCIELINAFVLSDPLS